MRLHSIWRRARRVGALSLVLVSTALITGTHLAHAAPPVRLAGHLPAILNDALVKGRVDPSETFTLALALPLRNQALLDDLLHRLYDPADPLHGHYLTAAEFTARFAPSLADYQAVADFARAHGLTIIGTHPNRTLLDVRGTAQSVEAAFGLHLMRYQGSDGRVFHAPDTEPSIPADLVGKLAGVIGLDNAGVIRSYSIGTPLNPPGLGGDILPLTIGSGPGGGLSPSDIKAAYNLSSISLTGSGQTLGLFELDGYKASDITHYESYFGLPAVTLQNVLVDSASGSAGSGADEVTLDIELQIALAPGASKILVYEAPNSTAGLVDCYNKIASDNLAKEISTSWGLYESGTSSSTLNSENTAFQQMATQGQSIFAAAGDSGAYDNGSSLSVDDPASQQYMVGVGGTSLTTTGPGGAWQSETTWNGGSVSNGAGGGGISSVWSIPGFQSGVVSAASKGSTTKRNVPDVSLDADPNTGYAIYYNSTWYLFGGTSCAAPLWSAFTALVNQQRAANGSALLGFADTTIYTIATSSSYTSDFHDIADNSTNLYYPAVTGYDDATGWGSFNGANLLPALVSGTGGGGGGGGGGTPMQLLGNPGFENGSSNPSPWSVTAGVVDDSSGEPAHSGSWKAWLDGYGTTHTDTIYQTVTIPSTITTATLTFWLHIDTAETTTTTAYDKLYVQIRSTGNTVLQSLATYSNLNAASGYTQKTFNLSAYKGQTIRVYLSGREDSSLQTSFVVDDFALTVQ